MTEPEDNGPQARDFAELTPRQVVTELDRYIIGQSAAKKSVAIALRNRWRRQSARTVRATRKTQVRHEQRPSNLSIDCDRRMKRS